MPRTRRPFLYIATVRRSDKVCETFVFHLAQGVFGRVVQRHRFAQSHEGIPHRHGVKLQRNHGIQTGGQLGISILLRPDEDRILDPPPLEVAIRRRDELFERVFLDKPYKDYLKQIATGILAGEYDEQLVYRKRLRRKLSEYTKNVPPHVQAARKSANPGKWISYAITLNGPEPLDATQSPLDYAHYLDRQIAPVVDGLLNLFGTSFAALTADQMEMF
ncbi:MAG: hypothetical protein IIB38_11825 [Candidatus Hydrogenedentes bacterium]|nr:hypothetical protein [Candidatus Hydrogenedentota bacterium]